MLKNRDYPYQRFCLLTDSVNIPDRNTIWHYQQRLGADGAAALFQALYHGWQAAQSNQNQQTP